MITIRTSRPIGHSITYARAARWVCPACGNADRALITDNGQRAHHLELTLLCLAQSGPCGDVDPDRPDDLTCGMQWEPNLEA